MGTALVETVSTGTGAVPLRILVLEGRSAEAEQIMEELRHAEFSAETTVAGNRSEFETALKSREIELVISAYALADWNGVEAMHQLREMGSHAPFLLVTSEGGPDPAELMRLGFDDCIYKDRLTLLPLAVKRALELKHLRDMNAQAQAALAASESRASELLEQSVYGIFRSAMDGAMLSANSALLKMLGCATLVDAQAQNLETDIFRFPTHCAQMI